MNNSNSQKVILEQIEILIAPLVNASQDEEALIDMLTLLGWDVDHYDNIPFADLQNALTSVVTASQGVTDLINNPPSSIADLGNALEVTAALFTTAEEIQDFLNGSAGASLPNSLKAELQTLGVDIIDLLVTSYLKEETPKIYMALVLLGVIEDNRYYNPTELINHPDGWMRLSQTNCRVRYDKINSLFSDPAQYLKDEFYPASQVIQSEAEAKEFSDKLFPRLQLMFEALGLDTDYSADEDLENQIDPNLYSKLSRTLTVSFDISSQVSVGASFLISPELDGGYGLVITPFGDWRFVKNLKNSILVGSVLGSLDGFAVSDSGVTFPSSLGAVNLEVLFTFVRFFGDSSTVEQIGSTNGTRLESGRMVFQAKGIFNDSILEYGGSAGIEEFKLVLGGGEGDNFLNKIFTNPVNLEFDILLGWKNTIGFYFDGSGSLKVAIPIHKDFFGIELKTLFAELHLQNGEALIEVSADTGIEWGPFVASINRLGLESKIQFQRGNLGPINGDLQFKPPNGVGLVIDSAAIKGGGFLSFDFQEERYVGALELTIKDKVALKVIGILTTKLPGNDDGYSLLLLITAEFEPINLGFGFKLSGVGGLIALNRTMNLNYLREGIKSNTLDNILFPQDPIQNINQIISDLEGAFPVQEGRYAFGPMAIIEWGTPTLITVELGLMIEVPSPVKLAILGVLKAILPAENKELLKLQVNFLGAIDFEAKFITFDASIFESKLLSFTLEGDMAFRLKYGDNKNFLFSIGGFHPAYTPPPLQLPAMKRLTINLIDGDNPRLTLTSYFAVTSNTVQFGSVVDFYYKISDKWSVIGYLGFDILIQFNPFYLNAAIAAQLALMRNGEAVVGIYLGGSVAGPAPWHVKGKAEITICGITLGADFDKTFGQPEVTTLPNIDVLPKLEEALTNKANWQTKEPENGNLLVTMRELDNAPGNIVAHPFGTLGVSQKVVPLNTVINKFGTQRPADFKKFGVELSDANDNPFALENLNESFAPAEYLQMSDSAKLTRNSFEDFNSGVSIQGTDDIKSSYLMERDLEFEQVILDSRNVPELEGTVLEPAMTFQAFTQNGTAAKSKLGTKAVPKSENAPAKVGANQEAFAIANTEDLTQYNSLQAGSEAEAQVMLEELLASDPALTDLIQVVPLYEVA